MKAAKWRDLSEDEVLQKARELSEEIFNLRFQLSTGMTKNPSRLSQARRDLARANTVLRERKGGSRGGAEEPRTRGGVRRDAEDAGGEDRAGVPPSPVPARHPDVEAAQGARREQREPGRRSGPHRGDPADLQAEALADPQGFEPRVLTYDPTALDARRRRQLRSQEGPVHPGDGRSQQALRLARRHRDRRRQGGGAGRHREEGGGGPRGGGQDRQGGPARGRVVYTVRPQCGGPDQARREPGGHAPLRARRV